MFEVLSYWDLGLAVGTALLALGEVRGLIVARRKGLTRNVSRLVTHGLIALLMLVYAWFGVGWLQTYQSLGTQTDLTGIYTMIWTYSLWGLAIALLVGIEISSHLRALSGGLTRNVTRLTTRLVMLMVLLVMLSVNLRRWDLFIDELEAPYRDAIPTSAAVDR